MTNEQLEKYSPFNAKNLSDEEISAMAGFTKDDLKALAEKYPNKAGQTAYLLLYDSTKGKERQIAQPSTWENIYQLHKIGQTQFLVMTFKSRHNPAAKPVAVAKPQDLTGAQAKAELGKQPKATATAKPTNIATNVDNKVQKLKEAGADSSNEGLTAEQIAAKEAQGIEGGAQEMPLDKMGMDALKHLYEKELGEVPEDNIGKNKLIAAIKKQREAAQ